jgi:hypothetical protein
MEGRALQARYCSTQCQRKDYLERPDVRAKQRQGALVWNRAHPERAAAKLREWHARHPEYAQDAHLRRYYGITKAQYDALLEAQGGVCALCLRPPGKRRLNVDHDHETGRVRGLLCTICNRILGWIEQEGFLERALPYLQR